MWISSSVFVLLLCISQQCTHGLLQEGSSDVTSSEEESFTGSVREKKEPEPINANLVDPSHEGLGRHKRWTSRTSSKTHASEARNAKMNKPGKDPRKPKVHSKPLSWIKIKEIDDSKRNRSRGGSDVSSEGESFITRGADAYRGLAPYQASLQMKWGGNWYHICGASLVKKDKVVTAGHCVTDWGSDPEDGNRKFRVGLGWHDIEDPYEEHRQTIKVQRIDLHPEYNDEEIGWVQMNDIAVLTLENDATLNTKVGLISMGDADDRSDWAEYDCQLTGWGLTEDGMPNVLQRSMLMVMTKFNCQSMWRPLDVKTHKEHEMCAIDYYDRSAACSGDSGGPLICNKRLAGVVSWGLSSCNGCFPSVFTRVVGYRPWVDDMLSGNYSQTTTEEP